MKTVALVLIDESNEFQRLLRSDAEAASRKAGLALEVLFSGAGNDFAAQLLLIRNLLARPARPDAIVVLPARSRGLAPVAQDAAREGVHWIFLSESEDDLSKVRGDHPGVALAVVCPDERETGRIQGRLFRQLAPAGSRILYVEGNKRSLAARERTAGVMEVLQGAPLELTAVEAGWTREDGHRAVGDWLRIALRAGRNLALVGCQNDMVALGAIAALREAAGALGRPDLAKLPIVGCDGAPSGGLALVETGVLAATVVLPRTSGAAIDLIARTFATSAVPPPLTMLKGAPFPASLPSAVAR